MQSEKANTWLATEVPCSEQKDSAEESFKEEGRCAAERNLGALPPDPQDLTLAGHPR